MIAWPQRNAAMPNFNKHEFDRNLRHPLDDRHFL
jgi:hypothetical protein